jgi:hypothetical protein
MIRDAQLTAQKRTRKLNDDETATEGKVPGSFRRNYQHWYTEALAVIRQIMGAAAHPPSLRPLGFSEGDADAKPGRDRVAGMRSHIPTLFDIMNL